jgi:hypothetical protein
MSNNPHFKELLKLIRSADRRHDTYTVFRDFCEMAAISLANVMTFSQDREDRYRALAKKHRHQIGLFPKMLGALTNAFEDGPDDYLGRAFHELELGNKWTGQFFTPYPVCRMMAKMSLGTDAERLIAERGFIRANEPACGAGAMVIALCQELRAAGINYQQALHVIAQDIDPRAVHMTYVQLTLMHCPAVVIQGSTLAVETVEEWRTPAHVLGFWDGKLRRADEEDRRNRPASPPPPEAPPIDRSRRKAEQLSLF